MSTLLDDSHPYWAVHRLVKSHHEIESVVLSYYVYRPQSLIDERRIFSLAREDFLSESVIHEVINYTPEGCELAIHSEVRLRRGEINHIPMIDMSTSARAHLEKLRNFIGQEEFEKFMWYRSGRSFHGYGNYLQTNIEWTRFLGQLLLANQKGLAPTVDPRWVGHRLISGYSALRWTRNTDQYLGIPTDISK